MNKSELESKMKKFGDNQESLATALGLSRTALNAKINSRNASFTQQEIGIIKKRYSLSCEEIDLIFFN
jgi:hypothetical protein